MRGGEFRLLVSLTALIRRLDLLYPGFTAVTWRVFRGAEGYGEYVCSLEDQLERREFVDVPATDAITALSEERQYFDHVHVRVAALGIEFGVHDNTFLYFRGPDDVTRQVAAGFEHTEMVGEAE